MIWKYKRKRYRRRERISMVKKLRTNFVAIFFLELQHEREKDTKKLERIILE